MILGHEITGEVVECGKIFFAVLSALYFSLSSLLSAVFSSHSLAVFVIEHTDSFCTMSSLAVLTMLSCVGRDVEFIKKGDLVSVPFK
jgi:hypothetical protein